MTFTSLPARIDQEVVAGTEVSLEFVLVGDGGELDLTNDTVQMIVVDSYGGTPVLLKANGVNQHSDPLRGRTQFIFTPSEMRTGVRDVVVWWYEIRRLPLGDATKARVHIQGEFVVHPSLLIS